MGKNVNGNESLGCISMRWLVDVPILECKFFAQHTPKLGGGGGGGGVRGHEPMLEMSYSLTLLAFCCGESHSSSYLFTS